MKKRMLIAMATVVAFAALTLGSAVPAFAGETNYDWGTVYNNGKLTVYNTKYMKEGGHWDNAFVDCNSKAKITSLTSSNPKVAKAYKSPGKYDDPDFSYGDSAEFRVKGVGKTTIKATISCEGKTYTQKLKLTVKKWANPLKTFKIGSKSYKSKFAKTEKYYAKKDFKNKKLTVKAAKNWKIKSIKGFLVNGNMTGKAVKVKNGSKITFSTVASKIEITCKNKKNGNVEKIVLQNQQVFG